MQKQKNEIENLQQTLNVKNMIIERDEFMPNFSTGSTAFSWKFNTYEARSYSPTFYNIMSRMRFRIVINCTENLVKIILHRMRGIYDHPTDKITTKMPHDFVAHIFGGSGKQKMLMFPKNTECRTISTADPLSEKYWLIVVKIEEVKSLAIDGYVHMHCYFQ